jgi:hypothetical protein
MDGLGCDASTQRAARGWFVLEVSQLVAVAICSPFFGLPLACARWPSGVKENSFAVGKVPRNYRFTDCWAQSTLAILFRPRGAERVQYEGIAYSQRGGIHHNLVGIKSLCVECHAPRLVLNGTAAVLTRGLSTVTVAVKPRGWSSVRHKCYLTLIHLSQRRVA